MSGRIKRWLAPSDHVVFHANLEENHPHHMDKENEGDMEVTLNGGGPSIRFRIGMMFLLQAAIGVVSFGILFAILRADVETLKEQVKTLNSEQPVIQQQMIEMKSTLGHVREDVIYIRGRIDSQQNKESK